MDFIHRVAPELREGIAGLPLLHLPEDLAAARNMIPLPTEPSDRVRITERVLIAGSGPVRIRIYEPAKRSKHKLPALLWTHGGGYILGQPSGDDALCESFVLAANCVVVSPDYRLAPEHPYPAAIEDSYAALVWLADINNGLSIDLTRIAVGGASAGGGLAAALALMARDKGGPALCFQLPLYPMLDDRNTTPSSYEVTHPAVWNRANNLVAWEMYLGGPAGGADTSPYAAPGRAEQLAGLPPAYICVGQLDPFRDETIDYVARLAQAGVEVEFHLYPGGYHGFEHVVPAAEVSRRAREGYIHALARALNS